MGLLSTASALLQAARSGGRPTVAARVEALILALLVSGGAAEALLGHVAVARAIREQKLDKAEILAVERFIPDRSAVVMTRSPWDLNEMARQPAVQIPNDDIATILRVACLTDAKYLIVDGRRAALYHLGPEVRSGRMTPLAPSVGLYSLAPC